MIILPAIDLLDGNCVRLVKGEYGTASKVAADPVETAKSFESAGAEYIHIVDLNGSLDGKTVNHGTILDIKKNITISIEVGGGIRDMSTVEYYIKNGVDRVILGSVALKNPELVKIAAAEFGSAIAVGIDAKNRKVSVSGWTDDSDIDFIELAEKMCGAGIKNIIYTDISKDGTLTGVNLDHYRELKQKLGNGIMITASGGVRDLEDIKNLKSLNLYGAICGKSVYAGTLDLKEAIEYTKK